MLWTGQVINSEYVSAGPPNTTDPGKQHRLTLRLQPYRKPLGHFQARPWLSQASQEAHTGHGRQASTTGWRHSQVTHLGGCTLWLRAELEQILPPCSRHKHQPSAVLRCSSESRQGELWAGRTREIVVWHHKKLYRKAMSW